MLCNPFIRMAVLSCIALSAACAGDAPQGDLSGNTEVNLVISDPTTAPEELLLLIDFVSYRITCPDSGLTPSYDDSVDLAGNFEVDATLRIPPVWEMVTDLPLSDLSDAAFVLYLVVGLLRRRSHLLGEPVAADLRRRQSVDAKQSRRRPRVQPQRQSSEAAMRTSMGRLTSFTGTTARKCFGLAGIRVRTPSC